MAETIYDMVIIGGGPGGYTTAIRAGQYGLKVALIEREKKLGGTCLHWGCIPTKSLLFDAELYDHIKNATEHGIEGVGEIKINWKTILDRKNGIITKHVKGLDFLMRKNKVTTVEGYGRLTGAAKDGVHSIAVESANGERKTVQAKHVVIATGSDARMLPGVEADGKSILTNMEILTLPQIPKSMVVIGAGAVGVEFGSIFKSFGSEITIVEYLPRTVPNEDEDVSKELSRVFRKRGIDVHTGAKVEKVEKTKDGAKVTFTSADGKQVVKEAEKVLVAVGRAPRTADLGLDKTKVQVERGFIRTDEWMQTAEPGIFAIGDVVAGLPQVGPCGRHVWHGRGRQTGRQTRQARAPRSYPRLHLLRAADRQRGLDGSPGQGCRPRDQGGQVPFLRQLQGFDRWLPRGFCEGGRRRQVR